MTIPVTVFSDYICPFCYIGSERLLRLRADYDMHIEWRHFEIHPHNPPEGMPLEKLGYPPAVWQRMMENLYAMAAADRIPIAERQFTTNSQRALLLAIAAAGCEEAIFERLHNGLFQAFFRDRLNIADKTVLTELATHAGMDYAQVESVWNDPLLEQMLAEHRLEAQHRGVTGTPTYFINEQRLEGAVSSAQLCTALDHCV